MRFGFALAAAIVGLASVPAGAAPVVARAQAGPVSDRVIGALSHRLFPLLDAIGTDPGGVAQLKAKPGVAAMLATRAERRAACADDLGCIVQALVWTQSETSVLATAVPEGTSSADDGSAAQARREIEGINTVLRTYGLGQVPRYPQIDGAGPIDPMEMRARLQAADWLSRTPRARSIQALDTSMDFALALLDVSDRTDAIGFDPLMAGLNAAPAKRARSLDWTRWRYSAMIVTGVGPETPDAALSPLGKYHIRLAAERYARGDIAVIIVTGGRAHPRATRFTEAEQMRAALTDRYGVPADAIVVEPYARHTTTNLRNATRLLVALGAPLDKDAVIVCNPGQSETIASAAFAQRNVAELGYAPGQVGRRVSPTELAFRPSPLSLRVDPRDPLDP